MNDFYKLLPVANGLLSGFNSGKIKMSFRDFFLWTSCYYIFKYSKFSFYISEKIYEFLKLKSNKHFVDETDIDHYVKFMIPFCIGYKIAELYYGHNKDKNIFNLNTFTNFCFGFIVNELCKNDKDSILIHLGFKCLKLSGMINIWKKYLDCEYDLDNICSDMVGFYLGCLCAGVIKL